MRIAHVCTRFSPQEHPGGVERVVQELAERQAEAGHDVEVLCRDEFDDPAEEEYDGVTVRRAPVTDQDYIRTLSSITAMRRLIRDSDAAVYHVHDWTPFTPYLAAGRPGRSVLTLHNLSGGIGGRLQRRMIGRADVTTAVSHWLADRLGGEVIAIPNGIDTSMFRTGPDDGYALMVSQLTRQKGVVRAAQACADAGIELRVVGTGPRYDDLAGIGQTELLGHVSQEELVELYSRCSFLLHAPREEGFGLVWAEALAAGKPVVCTDTGLGAILPGQVCERLPADHDHEELQAAIARIRDRSFDSDTIRTWAIQAFDWDGIVEEYMEVYEG